ncbi:MAG: oxidoreductase [Ignavibacteriaceae bacterium]|jgi:NAD(P)-dependent dehydrogenase (short-subunit alcohol dehydrogenase family)|nr:oxidoreductase [Ignavibacteriaceae bacterium]
MSQQKWDTENIPDQKGKVVIVTGSSSGIGFEAARVLASKNATVIIAVRNLEKGKNALNKIRAQYENSDVQVMELDLANLKSIRSFVNAFKIQYDKLDLLINNAGVMVPPYGKTEDGFELQFGTNHLGHFALTGLLIDLLKNTKDSRIVNVSSAAHKYGNLNFADLNWEKRKYKAWRAYGNSKISNLYFTYELQRRLVNSKSNVKVTAAHPGLTATDLQRHSKLFLFMNGFLAMKIWQGALPTLRAATDGTAHTGDYFGPDGWQEWRGYPTKVESNRLSHDKKIAAKLWEVSEQLTGIKFNL